MKNKDTGGTRNFPAAAATTQVVCKLLCGYVPFPSINMPAFVAALDQNLSETLKLLQFSKLGWTLMLHVIKHRETHLQYLQARGIVLQSHTISVSL